VTSDFLTLMLIDLVAGFFLLAHFVYRALGKPEAEVEYRQWVPGFLVVGFIAFLSGLVMTFAWPLSGSFNIAYGETAVLFGGLLLGATLAFAQRLRFESLALYALIAGAVVIVIGIRFLDLGLSKHPTLTGIGFILSGVVSVLAAGGLTFERARHNRFFRIVFALIALAAGVIWAFTAFTAYWDHLEGFLTYKPS
jgi:putative membrane protein